MPRSWRILVFAMVSLVGWTVYLWHQPRASPLADLGRGFYTDHFSHMNAARAFVFRGVNVWKVPLAHALTGLSPAERKALAPDITGVAGGEMSESYRLGVGPVTKPIVASWSNWVRPYPPGDLLAVLPVALVYQWTDLSFAGACRLLVWLFLLYGHIAFVLFARLPYEPLPASPVALGLVYVESVHWALNGFYDTVALIPLALMIGCIARRAWLSALLAFCFAAFFHYRAFYFAPLSLWFVVMILRERSFRQWKAREWIDVGLIAGLAAATLVTFAWVAPSLGAFPTYGPLSDPNGGTGARMVFLLVVAVLVVGHLWARSWLDALFCVWVAFLLSRVRQGYEWHALLLLPWLFLRLPDESSARAAVSRELRLATLLALAILGLQNNFMPGWILQLS